VSTGGDSCNEVCSFHSFILSAAAAAAAECLLDLYMFAFYPRDAMLARVIAIATCLSVRHAPVLCQNEES